MLQKFPCTPNERKNNKGISRYFIFFVILYLITFSSVHGKSQEISRAKSTWTQLTLKSKIKENWHLNLEGHLRNEQIYSRVYQTLLRPGVHYKFSKQTSIGLGYTYVRSNVEELDFILNEHNIYEEFDHKSNWKKLKLNQRIRFEQRYIEKTVEPILPENTETFFVPRFRYRFMNEYPVHEFGEKSTLYIVGFDEAMISFDEHLRPKDFNQNRLFLGSKIKFKNDIQFTTGVNDIWSKSDLNYNNNIIWDSHLSIPIR